MLRERQGNPESASRLQVRDARSLAGQVYSKVFCSVVALLPFRPSALVPETSPLPCSFGPNPELSPLCELW